MTYEEQKKEAFRILSEKIDELELECADNYRAAPVLDQEKWAKYQEIYESGCCGSFDTSVYINGIQWDIGCNYGH